MKNTPLPSTCYWHDEAPPLPVNTTPSSPPADADVVIIGGGFAGLSAALTLTEAGKQVVILEKGAFGSGAASRNGGITSGNLRYDYAGLRARFGAEKAQAIEDEAIAARADLYHFITRHNLQCDFTPSGRMTGLYQQHNPDEIKRECDRMARRHGIESRYISAAELSDYTAAHGYCAGVFNPDIHGIHPAKLLHEMVRLADEAGVSLCSHSPVQGVERHAASFQIKTEHTTITAEHVIGASNAYTDKALPWLRRRIIPVISEIITTENLGVNQVKSLMPQLNMFGEARALGYYYRPTPDGKRILLGGRRMHTDNAQAKLALHAGLSQLFSELKDAEITHYWSGYVGFALDQLPKLAVHDGIIYPCGFAGSGTVWARWLGQKAALMILGEDGVSQFEKMAMRTLPFYSGDPWFLPLAMRYYRLRDMLDKRH